MDDRYKKSARFSNLSTPYLIQKRDSNLFEFVTENGLVYVVYFIDYFYLFASYLSSYTPILSINIELKNLNGFSIKEDPRVGATIVEMLRQFFQQTAQVLVYVCDNSDCRQHARKRKFDHWFNKYSDGSLLKKDGSIIADKLEILNAIIIHKEHPYFNDIIHAFSAIHQSSDEK
jgi:hypothetical protein